jgi:hypothetical protein
VIRFTVGGLAMCVAGLDDSPSKLDNCTFVRRYGRHPSPDRFTPQLGTIMTMPREKFKVRLTSHGPCDGGSRAIVSTFTRIRPNPRVPKRPMVQGWCESCHKWVGLMPISE